MKKSFSIITVLVIVALSSCKKDYTCVCTSSGTTVSTTTIHATKSNATSQCSAMSSSGNNGKTCSIQ